MVFLVQLKELYILLNENYVEDDDNMFRFDYSPEFLKWYVLIKILKMSKSYTLVKEELAKWKCLGGLIQTVKPQEKHCHC